MKINLVYFSCGRDEEMLELSIEASRRNYDFNKIFVFSDKNDPVKKAHQGTVLVNRKSGSEKLYGLENISDMHDCMKLAAGGCDYILKKDSDVLDCSPYAYEKLAEGRWDFYGGFPMARESIVPDLHFNGNAYFIKSEIVREFPENISEVAVPWKILNYPEDMVTSAVCNSISKNGKVEGTAQSFNGNYLFDIFLSKVAAQPVETIQSYGFAHCRTNPRVMKYLFDQLYSI